MLRRPAPAEVSPRVLALLAPDPPAETGWLPEPPWDEDHGPVDGDRGPVGSRGPVDEASPSSRPTEPTDPGGPAEPADPTDAAAVVRSGRHRRPRRVRPTPPAILTTPVSVRAARYHVSWRAVTALAVVLIVALLVFTVRVARAEQTATPSPVPGSTPAALAGRSMPSAFASGGSAGDTRGARSSATSAGPDATGAGGAARGPVVVHVVGQVARPGVVTVAPGGRVVDAIGSAGGPLPGADLQRVNLARVVADGEQIFVPRPGEEIPPAAARTGVGGPSGDPSGGTAGPVVDLNTADLAALDSLPGVGPVLGQRILDWRSDHGRFSSVDELGEVSGIGQKLLSQIRVRVRV